MVFTTYPLKGERPVTPAEIDRLTAIIERLKAVCARYADGADLDAATINRLDHQVELQTARADVAEALLAGRASDDAGLVVSVAVLEEER